MSTLTLLLIRLAFLAVLWLFVITAVVVVRTDLFGQSPASRKQKRQRQNARPRQARPARPAKPGRSEPQRLLVTGGQLSGTALPLTEQQITIGRSNDATLVLNDEDDEMLEFAVKREGGPFRPRTPQRFMLSSMRQKPTRLP